MSYYVFEELNIELLGKWDPDTIRLMNLFLKTVEPLCGAEGCFGSGFAESEAPDCIEWEWCGNHGMTDFFKDLTFGSAYPNVFESSAGTGISPEQWAALMQRMKKKKLSFELFSAIDGEGVKWCETNEYYSDGEKLCYKETESWDIEPEWSDYDDSVLETVADCLLRFAPDADRDKIKAFILDCVPAPEEASDLCMGYSDLFEDVGEDSAFYALSEVICGEVVSAFERQFQPGTSLWDAFLESLSET